MQSKDWGEVLKVKPFLEVILPLVIKRHATTHVAWERQKKFWS